MSVANKDEAFKCLSIAKRHLAKGDGERARHFGQKAKTLYPCPEVDTFLKSLESSGASAPRSETTPKIQDQTGGTSASTSSAPRNGNAATPAQREMVARIRASKGDFYKILNVERSADDDEIKKAYRKLALKLHPDKCQAPGAEEAFKQVSKAFTCLADPQKRAFYDRTGHEDSSSAAAAQRQQGGMGPGMHFNGEMSPEDLFNMMFGGGMGGFGMGPMHFGGFHGHPQFRQRRRHPQQQQEEATQQQDPRQRFGGLLNVLGPIFLLLVVMFSNSSTPPAALHMSRSYPVQMYTDWNSVPFYVKDRSGFLKEYPNHSIRRQKFEHMIEQEWKEEMQQSCNYERMKEREVHRRTKSRNRKAPLPHVAKPSCDKLKDFHSGKRADPRSRESAGDANRVIHDDF